jgi:hypothetical protein
VAGDGDAVERTEDGRYVVVDGRRWRASDPAIPERLRAELVAELMRARRLVRTRSDEVRPMVHDAKVALGERGRPWWEEPTEEAHRERLAATIRALLRHRDGSTICPSDAARVVGGQSWRRLMEPARQVARALRDDGVVELRQRGERVDEPVPGPLRIAPGPGLRR